MTIFTIVSILLILKWACTHLLYYAIPILYNYKLVFVFQSVLRKRMDKTKECYKDFKVEKDAFCLEPDSAEGVEERWFKLGAILVNENSAKRFNHLSFWKSILKEFQWKNHREVKNCHYRRWGPRQVQNNWTKENSSFDFSQVDERLSSEGFLLRFLRASCWDVEGALRILKLYSNLGAEYRCYVSRAIPSR